MVNCKATGPIQISRFAYQQRWLQNKYNFKGSISEKQEPLSENKDTAVAFISFLNLFARSRILDIKQHKLRAKNRRIRSETLEKHRICCHIGGFLLSFSSALSLSKEFKKMFFNTLFSFEKASYLIKCILGFLCHIFCHLLMTKICK